MFFSNVNLHPYTAGGAGGGAGPAKASEGKMKHLEEEAEEDELPMSFGPPAAPAAGAAA